jgi:exosortase D (VPLPA-CTERM-specific)
MVNKRQVIFIGILGASFFFCFWTTLKGLFNVWTGDGDYNYAPLLPLMSAYLIWEKQKEIAAVPISTNWWGFTALLIFMILAAYGILGSSPSAVRPAIPFVILCVTLLCFGNGIFRIVFFPLCLVFFMIPLPTVLSTWIGLPLKSISTKVGALMLRIGGVPAYIEGNIIDLGVTQLQVVDACSGLRYILPLFALGVIFAYFFEKVRWKQLVLAMFTIPVAITINGFRIGVTGILTQWVGKSAAEGFFHDFSGWLIFVFAFAMLFVFHRLMKAAFRGTMADSSKRQRAEGAATGLPAANNTIPVITSSTLLILVGILGFSAAALPSMSLPGGFVGFPMTIGEWRGRVEAMDQEIVRLSGAEEALNAIFANPKGEVIYLYVGYRGSPFLESENFFHSPNVCIPSSGWSVLSTKKHRVSGVPGLMDVPMTEMITEKQGERRLVSFWFQTKNRVSDNVNINRLHLSLHAMSRDNTYDLFMRPIAEIRPSEKVEDAEARLDGFVREMMPVLLQFLKEKQVQRM